MGELVKDEALYTAIKSTIQNIYFDLHAIYEPEERGWYCAAVDLFKPGMTFRLYFTLGESNQVQVEHVERWYFG